MIGFGVTVQMHIKAVEQAADRATIKNISHASAAIRKTAIESIKPGDGPSPVGTPPHTHTQKVTRKGKTRKGQLPRAIVFDVNKQTQTAVVGPRASVVGTAGAAHEFGGEYKGDVFDQRPFMGPALNERLPMFADSFAHSIGG